MNRPVGRCLVPVYFMGLSVFASVAHAQTGAASPFGILDNSFLVEEAFNQEAGIFQNIFVITRSREGAWGGSFTQEWPIRSVRHQASYTVPFSIVDGTGEVGEVAFNYRFQVWEEGPGWPAFAPRISVGVPTSAPRRRAEGLSWQANLPFSKAAGRVYLHGNAGGTFADDRTVPFVAGSAIVAVSPLFNLMFESLVLSAPGDEDREVTWVVSPGLRAGWNIGPQQVVAGLALPVTRGAARDAAVLGYLSYELPFRK